MTRTGRRRFVGAQIAVVGLLSVLSAAAPWPSGGSLNAAGSSTFSKSETITRNHLIGGQDDVVDTRNVHVTVSQTTGLRDRQELRVTWSGAHPTGGIVPDQNAAVAGEEEYPVVLLQCRGVDSTSVPVEQQLDPSTCWLQTAQQRFFGDNNNAFPAWRVDRYASVGDRAAIVGAPDPRPSTCPGPILAERWIPFRAATGTTYYGGPRLNGCAGLPPEASAQGSLTQFPSNETYGVTDLDGTGATNFEVWTADENASLGCSDTVPCALVVVPIMGVSCDVDANGLPPEDVPQPGTEADTALANCMATGGFEPGSIDSTPTTAPYNQAVSGQLWWTASNWHNRITVPLQFAQSGNVCDLSGGTNNIDLYGSELMIQASTQWQPHFCLKQGSFTFKHVQTGEPEARNLLQTGNIEAAMVSEAQPGGYPNPTVNAPIGVSGFAVSYDADDRNGKPLASMRLDARLLAKLLTESYPAVPSIKSAYAALAHNPLDITEDPEFQALNPDVPKTTQIQSASTLLALSSDSDVMAALTAYINADSDARAWLNGRPDPWGMVVNPNYKGIKLPVDNWPLLDTFTPLDFYSSSNDCLNDNPVPFLPLVAAPMSRLFSIGQSMQFNLANSTTVCNRPLPGFRDGEKLVSIGRETPGHRFLLGLTSLADSQRYQLSAAQLETRKSATAAVRFTNASGRSFIGPSDASLRNAAALAKPDTKTGTWPISRPTLRTSANGGAAYPGTMVVYAAIPTTGLKAADAKDYASFLRFAAGPGQTPGANTGELPAGYLPLTKANGLGDLANYTMRAADAVAAQSGTVPSLIEVQARPTVAPATPPHPGSGSGGGTAVAGVRNTAVPTLAPTPVVAPQQATGQLAGVTKGAAAGAAGLIVPVLMGVVIASGGAAYGTRWFGLRRARR